MMFEALFLNPLTKTQMKSGIKVKSKSPVRSKRLKGWQAMVKKHGGDLQAASKEWKSRSGTSGASRRGAGSAAAKGRGRKKLSGLSARWAASGSKGAKGGVQMAARKTKTKTKKRQTSLPPTKAWIAKWRAGMTATGRKLKASAPVFSRISSDPTEGEAQWKKKYKAKLTAAMKKHATKTKGGKRGGAKKFAQAVTRGVAAFNPLSAEQWRSRFVRATGYGPYKKTVTKRGKTSKRRSGAHPMTQAWRQAVVKGVKHKGAKHYASAIARPGLPLKYQEKLIDAMTSTLRKRAMNPVKSSRRGKKGGKKSMRRYPILRASQARKLMLNMSPYKRKAKKKSATRRRRNPVGTSLQAMISPSALTQAAYVTGGVAIGAVVPNIVARYIWQGEKSPATEAAIGVVGSIAAGLGVSMATKDNTKGTLVAAGGLAGVVGNLIASQLNKALGFSGFGQSAEDALKAAVETEMERAGLSGMGQFLLPSEAEDLPNDGSAGMGQFLTEPELQTDIAQIDGLGASPDLEDEGTGAFAGIDGSVFG